MKRQYLAAIGFMVLLALAMLTRALLFLHPAPGDEACIIHVRFQNVDKIGQGTRVTFAGKPIGEVKKVELLPEAFSPRVKGGELIYPYELTLAIDSSVKVYKSDDISEKTAGLMGEKCIAITPRTAPKGSELITIGPNDIVYASQPGSVEDTFGEISSVAKKADQTMEALIRLIERNQEGLSETTKAIQKASEQLELLLTTLNTEDFGKKLPLLCESATSCVNQVREVARSMEDTKLVPLMRELVDDIHNYGLLFHLNRSWQREMYRRKEEASLLPINAEGSTQDELRKVYQTTTRLQQEITSINETINKGSFVTKKELRAQLQQKIDKLQDGIKRLSEDIQTVDLEPNGS
jgi:phospholipid/cholesterol/gamma-HCH transport system substrate-binding protein